jgi:hypothetical protein
LLESRAYGSLITRRWKKKDSNSLRGSAEPAKLRVFIAQSKAMVSRQKGAWYHNLQAFQAALRRPDFRSFARLRFSSILSNSISIPFSV